MTFKSDIEIAQEAKAEIINNIADKLSIDPQYVENYGKYKAKIDYNLLNEKKEQPDAKLILVTAINPHRRRREDNNHCRFRRCADASWQKNCNRLARAFFRPVFGVKGGAAGGGYAQVIPMEDINLHFTVIFTLLVLPTI